MPAAGPAPSGEGFFAKYKWWIAGGVLLAAAGVGAYFLLRQKSATTSGIYDPKPCTCGSGEPRYPVFDARGIFVTFACPRCEAEKKSHYREDIFTDPGYWTDEPVEPED